MFRKIQRSFTFKVIAAFTAVTMVTQVFYPSLSFALTSGPSQPEVASFEPVGTTDMVDMFSGDFNYNIPLLTVPGSNGGYPINLHYHSGIGVDQEASWVGLGWNINPGVINRVMRGMPDDFNGDQVTKQNNMKPNVTIGLGLPDLPEIFGAEMQKVGVNLSYQLYYNNYRGIGHRLGLGLSVGDKQNSNFNTDIGIASFGTDGLVLTPSLSLQKTGSDVSFGASVGFNYSSREGFSNLNFQARANFNKNMNRTVKYKERQNEAGGDKNGMITATHSSRFNASSVGAGMSFSGATGVPNTSLSMGGLNLGFSLRIESGPGGTEWNTPLSVNGNFSSHWVSYDARDYTIPAYGYNYTGERDRDPSTPALMDYSREKNFPIHQRVPYLPVPQFTHDVYSVSGQGVAGAFRPFRTDFGFLYNPGTKSYSGAGRFGTGLGKETSPPGFKVSVDVSGTYSYSYSGPWTSGLTNQDQLKFKDEADILTENMSQDVTHPNLTRLTPFIYKMNGEQTAVPKTFMDHIGGEDPVSIPLSPETDDRGDDMSDLEDFQGEDPYEGSNIFDAKLQPLIGGMDKTDITIRDHNEKMVQHIQYLTRDEKVKSLNYTNRTYHIYDKNKFPHVDSQNGAAQYDYSNSNSHLSLGGSDIGHHVAEYTVVNPDGNRYTYGLPVYNIKEKQATFSVTGTDYTPSTSSVPKYITYQTDDNTLSNSKGVDHYFSSTEVPHYAYSYMLTQITGPDYVDRTGDGISDDDFGYYIKFNYSRMTAQNDYYKWRVPYGNVTKEASLAPGFLSNEEDDKASYTYGEKEIWYVNSIETNTHIAVFYTSDREDGLGVADEDGAMGSPVGIQQQKLDSIALYSKKDLEGTSARPIKVVHFAYSYDLAGKDSQNNNPLVNNEGGTTGDTNPDHRSSGDANENRGKLTLKKVWFTYRGNTKGELSPYYFDYHERLSNGTINDDENPCYHYNDMDRWGNYRSEGSLPTGYDNNTQYPYVRQEATEKATIDEEAGVWNLKEIWLPSGGKMKINYEADDYAYVQDKIANQMCQIVGTGKDDGTDDVFFNGSTTTLVPISDVYQRIYFKPEEPISSDVTTANNQIAAYVANLNKDFLFFKAYERLTIPKGLFNTNWAFDYVEGYAKIEGSGYITTSDDIDGFASGSKRVPYVVVKQTENNSDHPMRMAGWQSIRYQRSDLTSNGSVLDNATPFTVISLAVDLVSSIVELFAGYYNMQRIKGNASSISNNYPSFIRLSDPNGRKYGGGHRVKDISIVDEWDDYGGTESEYGQEYYYTMPDGTSSGVASYEPIIGGEEIPHRIPHYYGPDNVFLNDPAFYLEEPFGESYFPGASVGYRRVVVENINHGTGSGEVLKTAEGITVHEFYTAKDFPVVVEHTNNTKEFNQGAKIIVPLIGQIEVKSSGYSQGYKIELNDMHGKLRSMSVYDADVDPQGDGTFVTNKPVVPVKKTEYIYKTKQPFSDYNPNRLDNLVDVMIEEGDVIKSGDADGMLLGQNYEFFGDMEENYAMSVDAGFNFNLTFYTPVIFVPMGMPSFGITDDKARIVTTNKVIYKTGIQEKVINTMEGGKVTQQNLYWDAETGGVVLSRTTTEYNDKVADNNDFIYQYNIPAHWNYEEMSGSYKNYRTLIKPNRTLDGSGKVLYALTNVQVVSEYVREGDQVMIYQLSSDDLTPVSTTDNTYWVTNIDETNFNFQLMDKNGNLTSTIPGYDEYLKVTRPVRTNQQGVTSGFITALQDPVVGRTYPYITAMNNDLAGTPSCTHPSLPSDVPNNDYYFCFDNCEGVEYYGRAYLNNGKLYLYANESPTGIGADGHCMEIIAELVYRGTPPALNGFRIENITRQYITLSENGTDIKLPVVSYKNECVTPCLEEVLNAGATEFSDDWDYNYADAEGITPTSTNDYYVGKKGIWRTYKGSLYQVSRKQLAIGTPGDYKSYTGKDGTFEYFKFYLWNTDPATSVDQRPWTWTSQITQYSPYGYERENQDALGRYSSALYGYGNILPIAVSQNASVLEIGYDGFEEYGGTTGYAATYENHGHLEFSSVIAGTNPLTNALSHTGNYCLQVGTTTPCTLSTTVSSTIPTSGYTFTPVLNKTYVISGWIYQPYDCFDFSTTPNATLPGFDVDVNGNVTNIRVTEFSPSVEGWIRVEGEFKVTTTGSVTITLVAGTGTGGCTQTNTTYFDDIRIQPLNSAMKTYVYDLSTHWLMAELDNNNYATFYNYDEEGSLVQVKKETEKGVMTIQSNRSNTKR